MKSIFHTLVFCFKYVSCSNKEKVKYIFDGGFIHGLGYKKECLRKMIAKSNFRFSQCLVYYNYGVLGKCKLWWFTFEYFKTPYKSLGNS